MKLNRILLLSIMTLLTSCRTSTPPVVDDNPEGGDDTKPSKTINLKVMSCNLDQANGTNTEYQLKVFEKINNEKPDIFGVQEETKDWENYLKSSFRNLGYEHVTTYRGGSYNESSGIFYNVDRFKCLDKGGFWLGSDPNAGSGYIASERGALFPRVCTFVKLQDKKNDEIFSVYNTHYDYVKDTPFRLKASEQIITKIKESKTAAIFMGDLNFHASAEMDTYNTLTSYFDDAYNVIDPAKKSCTYNNYGVEENEETRTEEYSPIDYIFNSKGDFKATEFDILKNKDGTYYSDHYFIKSIFEYQ